MFVNLCEIPIQGLSAHFYYLLTTHMLALNGSIRHYFYNDKYSNQGISFKQFLYYVQAFGSNSLALDIHFSQQYVPGEENFIQCYIPLEDFNTQITKLEHTYDLIKSPLALLTNSDHHRAHKMIYAGAMQNLALQIQTSHDFQHTKAFMIKKLWI